MYPGFAEKHEFSLRDQHADSLDNDNQDNEDDEGINERKLSKVM